MTPGEREAIRERYLPGKLFFVNDETINSMARDASTLLSALDEAEAEVRRKDGEIGKLREALRRMLSFIENLTTPQTIADAALQVIKAGRVLHAARAALGEKEAESK